MTGTFGFWHYVRTCIRDTSGPPDVTQAQGLNHHLPGDRCSTRPWGQKHGALMLRLLHFTNATIWLLSKTLLSDMMLCTGEDRESILEIFKLAEGVEYYGSSYLACVQVCFTEKVSTYILKKYVLHTFKVSIIDSFCDICIM